MFFVLEQDDESEITPMPLTHLLHPIRSDYKHRNL